MYKPDGNFKIHSKSNDAIELKKQGVNIDINNKKFTEKMIPSVAKHVKEDKLWKILNQNPFQMEIKNNL